MIRLAALLVALLAALPVEAKPISLRCTVKDRDAAAYYGRLSLVVDLDALSIKIEAPEKHPGFGWAYRNGQVAPFLVQVPPGTVTPDFLPATTPVLQFVEITPQIVRMGWRFPNGELGQMSSFNRSALASRPAPCIWHRATEFGLS